MWTVMIMAGAAMAAQQVDEADTPSLPDAQAQTDALAALDWLEGCWAGPGFDGVMSECWMPAASGELVGAFQYSAHGELQFSEMLMIGMADGRFGYHVKHFNRDFTGWEDRDEQVTFSFQDIDETGVRFGGLNLERDGDNTFHAHLDMRGSDDIVRTITLTFQRVR